jgi:hypothetical protein
MSKRNLTLLIIVLIIIIIVVFGFLYYNKPVSPAGNNTSGTNFFSQFNPFASNKTTTPPATTAPVTVSGYQPPATQIIKLQKVSSMPIAGFTMFSKERLVAIPVTATSTTDLIPSSVTTATTTTSNTTTSSTTTKKVVKKPMAPLTEFALALRYVARATGNIYETFADNIQEGQFTTTVIPKVYDAYFGNSGNSVVMRYLQGDGKTIETFWGNLPKEILGADTIADNTIKGSLLPNNIKNISVSPDASSIFYLFDNGNDMIGTTLNFLTSKKVQILDSPFTEWSSWWGNNKMITLTTKPASSVPGYMYTMDSSGKNFNQVLSSINGLTTEASPDGKLILYGDNNLNLNVYNISTNTSTLLGVRTLPEKCVWGSASDVVYCAVPRSVSSGQYPDSWYQGEISFSDQFWKIDIKTGNTTMLVDPLTVNGGGDIDGIKLALDNGQNYLFFVNKKDSFLWEFSLK